MEDKFSRWYQSVAPSRTPEQIKSRYDVAESLRRSLDRAGIQSLVRFVFGRTDTSKEAMAKFSAAFKEKDATFGADDNPQEVLVLAACVLALAISDEKAPNFSAANAILAASFDGKRTPKLGFDLLGVAQDASSVGAIRSRKRQAIGSLKRVTYPLAKFEEQIKSMEASQSFPHWLSQIKNANSEMSSYLTATHKNLIAYLEHAQRLLNIQDEELEILWWLVGGWSTEKGLPFLEIAEMARPIMLAREVAGMAVSDTPPPALPAILVRAGQLRDEEISIKQAVNAYVGVSTVGIGTESPCSMLTPIFFALLRAKETNGGDDWVSGWSGATGLPTSCSMRPANLALQVFREARVIGSN